MSFTEILHRDLSPQPGSSTHSPARVGTGCAHGTFGELLQGSLQQDNDHFLVTLPIQRCSRAMFTPDTSSDQITVSPGHKLKSRELVQKLVDYFGHSFGGHLSIESDLPEGKGMASSSADLVATARAFESALGHDIPTEVILELLRTIEPTDGVMYPEFVTFFHRKVELVRRLGFPSRIKVVAIDEGGQVDTIEYNQRHRVFTDQECAEYAELLQTLETAILGNDLALLGRVTTRSAILNQKRNPKRHLDLMIEIGKQTGALGVVVAHSGPCLGLMFPDEPGQQEQIEQARCALAKLTGDVFIVESLDACTEPARPSIPPETSDASTGGCSLDLNQSSACAGA